MNRNIPIYVLVSVSMVVAALGFVAGQRGFGTNMPLGGVLREWRAGIAGSVTAISETAITIAPRDTAPLTLPMDGNVKILRAVRNEELKRYEAGGEQVPWSELKTGDMVGVNLVSDLRSARIEEIHILSGITQP